MTDDDLFEQLKDEYEDLGFKDFNELLLKLEVSGKIRTSSMSRGKRRIELSPPALIEPFFLAHFLSFQFDLLEMEFRSFLRFSVLF